MAIHCHRPNLGPYSPEELPSVAKDIYRESHYDDVQYQFYVECHWHEHSQHLWSPLQEFMSKSHPLSNKVCRKALQDFDMAHDALQDLWSAIRAVREKLLTAGGCPANRFEGLTKIVREGLSEEYQAERAQERHLLQEAVQAKGTCMSYPITSELPELTSSTEAVTRDNQIRDSKRREDSSTPPHLPTIQKVGHESRERPGSHSASPRVKIKTRRVNVPPEENDRQQDVQGQELVGTSDRDKIPVSKASLDIFRRCFVSYGKHSNGNVRFELFARALVEAGLSPSQSAVGSAVTFRGDKGSIAVHKPHPVPTINPICLRAFGKRLNHAFGWDMDTFVLRTQSTD